jgi:hypothetical protein
MPAQWVALRHEIAHGPASAAAAAAPPPSLRRLHACAEEALAWLWARYWRDLEDLDRPPSSSMTAVDAVAEADAGAEAESMPRADVVALLRALLRARKDEMRGDGDASDGAESADSSAAIMARIVAAHRSRAGLASLACLVVVERRLLPRSTMYVHVLSCSFPLSP